MTEVSICLNERGCRHTGVFDGTQPRCRWWLLFTEVFMSDMQKMIQRILTAPCQLSHRTFWEIDHIFSYRQEVCSFCTHPLIPKPIVFFFFYILQTRKLLDCFKNYNNVNYLAPDSWKWNHIFLPSPLQWKWDWTMLPCTSAGHIPNHVYGTEKSHWSQ